MDLAAEPSSLKTRTAPGRTTTMTRSPTIYSDMSSSDRDNLRAHRKVTYPAKMSVYVLGCCRFRGHRRELMDGPVFSRHPGPQ